MPFADTFSPVLHRIDQAIRFRAANSVDPIPPPADILTKYSHPPVEIVDATKTSLKKLIAAADVKKVPPKVLNRKRNRESSKPLSGLDVGALLQASKPSTHRAISASNPIPEFRQVLDHPTSPDDISTAAAEFGSIIAKHIEDSFGHQNYDRVIEEMRVLRTEMVEMEEPGLWNDWVRKVKGRLLKGELGGDRFDLWWRIKKNGLGLVGKGESAGSDISEDEMRRFLVER